MVLWAVAVVVAFMVVVFVSDGIGGVGGGGVGGCGGGSGAGVAGGGRGGAGGVGSVDGGVGGGGVGSDGRGGLFLGIPTLRPTVSLCFLKLDKPFRRFGAQIGWSLN